MPNTTSQVPSDPAALEAVLDYMLGLKGEPLVPPPAGSKRVYPGEGEAEAVLRYMAYFMESPKEKRIFLKSWGILRSFEVAIQRRDVQSVRRLALASALRALQKLVIGKSRSVSWQRGGLVVTPSTEVGFAALGLLSLANMGLVTRIRPCKHCLRWFFARFKHQQFCGDRETECQWSHYHTPEWRKKHRESNRKHQRNYRERLFGKRSK